MEKKELLGLLKEVEDALFFLAEEQYKEVNRAYVSDLFYRFSDAVKELRKEA